MNRLSPKVEKEFARKMRGGKWHSRKKSGHIKGMDYNKAQNENVISVRAGTQSVCCWKPPTLTSA